MNPRRAWIAVAVAAAWAFAAPSLAQEPEYPHGDYDGDCETCHTSESWRPAWPAPEFRERHPFPLRDAHAVEDCGACHATLRFREASAACVDCHLDPHRGELGIDCATCHVPRTFLDRTRMLRSHQATRFPLRGSHRALDCEDCHVLQPPGALRWVGLPTACVDCHAGDYPAGHETAGFPTTCDECHAPTLWGMARFNHTGITSGCVDCHRDDYDRTNDPDHGTVGFPTSCEDCHSTRTWDDADFDHDRFFPITSGAHAGRWDSCSTCHVNPGNYADFSCFGCHPHSDRGETDRRHSGVDGYDYVSRECLRCHPDGRE